MSWDTLDKVLTSVDFLNTCGVPNVQIRRVARASKRNRFEAEVWLKYLMGREVILLDKGADLLKSLEAGRLGDAFVLYNLFKGGHEDG